MRTSYHEELDAIIDNLVHMAELVETAIKEGSESLLTADLARAEAVITNDAELDRIHEEMEYKCLSLLALQAPVAGELKMVPFAKACTVPSPTFCGWAVGWPRAASPPAFW